MNWLYAKNALCNSQHFICLRMFETWKYDNKSDSRDDHHDTAHTMKYKTTENITFKFNFQPKNRKMTDGNLQYSLILVYLFTLMISILYNSLE